MHAVITGAAGFIGSTLTGVLLQKGFDVTGIDSFDPYYSPAGKRENIREFLPHARFTFLESDAAFVDTGIFSGAEYVFHLAGQPGVRASWGSGFSAYAVANVLLTQHILEQIKDSRALRRFVFASSSSVYGFSSGQPFRETDPLRPASPYGVTKQSAESLCALYGRTYGVPVVCLRYFTVYGPRQRPDMAFCRFFRAALAGEELVVYGNGTQSRDFTFVGDIVRATVDAAFADIPEPCAILNIGSGRTVLLSAALEQIGAITGKTLRIVYADRQTGDMHETLSDISKARRLLGYSPSMNLADGLREEYKWIQRTELVFS